MEYLESLDRTQVRQVLKDIVRLCDDPAGKHPLSGELAGLNTMETLQKEHRVVYGARDADGAGLIEVLAAGPRRDNEVYDLANALRHKLTEAEWTQVWDVLQLVDQVAEEVGLDPWDHTPDPAPKWKVESAVSMGVLDREYAEVMGDAELDAAMAAGFSDEGPDKAAAINAAMSTARAAGHPRPSPATVFPRRSLETRCGVIMERAGAPCIRRSGHPGAHRAVP